MTLAVVLAATALFFVAMNRSSVIGLSYRVMAESNGAFRLIADPALDDDAKEIAARRLAVKMLGLFGRIAMSLLIVLLPPAALVTVAVAANATDLEHVFRVSVSWPLLAANALFFTFILFRQRRT